jgi:hypothetical protein
MTSAVGESAMENDSIRPSGSNTLVDLWIDGKLRSICVSQEAIGAFVGFDQAGRMGDRDRCEFVRSHLGLIVTAAKARLVEVGPTADGVVIDCGQLERPDGHSGDRRKGERRSDERRKSARPKATATERRRRERRQGERRTKPPTRNDG